MEQPVKSKEAEGPDEWEVKQWADTVHQAEEIKQDPKKWALVKDILNKKVKTISSIAELRDIANGNDELPSEKAKKKV